MHLEPVQDLEVIQRFEQCCRLAGVKKNPELYSSENIHIPFVFGFFRPVIAVPDGFLHPSKQNELKYTLLHELTHINRKDNLWLPFERVLHNLYFFHPVMRWMGPGFEQRTGASLRSTGRKDHESKNGICGIFTEYGLGIFSTEFECIHTAFC